MRRFDAKLVEELESLLKFESFIQEGKRLPIGTIRKWSDGHNYKKTGAHTWLRVTASGAISGEKPPSMDKSKQSEPSAKPKAKISTKNPQGRPAGAKPVEHPHKKKPGASEAEASYELKFTDFDVPPVGEWVDKAPGLPESTSAVHFNSDGIPKAYRAELHDRIVKDIVSKVPSVASGHQKHAILTMGAPAAGKSSYLSKMIRDQYVRADADVVKEHLPEFTEAKEKRARNAADMVHKESGFINDRVVDAAIDGNKHLILDGVGSNPDYYKSLVRRLKSYGYHVTLMMAHLDSVEEAVSRAEDRGHRIGRWVDEDYIRDIHPKLGQNFLKIMPDVDDFKVVNTNNLDNPVVAWEKDANGELIHDDAFVTKHFPKDMPEWVHVEMQRIFEVSKAESKKFNSDALIRDLMKASVKYQEILLKFNKKYNKLKSIHWPADDITGMYHKMRNTPHNDR